MHQQDVRVVHEIVRRGSVMKETKYSMDFDMRIYNTDNTYSIYRIQNTGKDHRRSYKLNLTAHDHCHPCSEKEVIQSQITCIDSLVGTGFVSSLIDSLKKKKGERSGMPGQGIDKRITRFKLYKKK